MLKNQINLKQYTFQYDPDEKSYGLSLIQQPPSSTDSWRFSWKSEAERSDFVESLLSLGLSQSVHMERALAEPHVQQPDVCIDLCISV